MTSDFDPISPEVNHSSPGKMLRDAREKLGLTQEQVAKELYMTLTKVRYIESDEYNRLHSDTFIRGYLRAYAQLVKVDLEGLLAIYDNQARRLGLKEEFVPIKPESTSKKIWQFVALLLGLLLLMWLVSVWFLDNRKKNDYSDAPVTVTRAIVPPVVQSTDGELIANTSTGTDPVNVTGVNTSEANQSSVDASSASQSSAISKLPAPPTAIAERTDKLEFYFSDECWLEVSDAKGDVLATDLQLKGSRLVLEGQGPFEIKMGNAPAVSVKLNDEDVKLVPALGTNVLTIKLGSSGQ